MTAAQPRRLGRSVLALAAGFVVVVVLSLGTDEVLHLLHIYPPWSEPMTRPGLYVLALAYRCIFTFLGGWVTARLAPHSPMAHVLVGCGIGLVLGTAGVVAAMSANLGPVWYAVGVAVTGPICNWLGGWRYVRARSRKVPSGERQFSTRTSG